MTGVTAEAKILRGEDDPIEKTRPAGGGKARRIGMDGTSNSTGPVGCDAGNPVAESAADFKAQEKVSGKHQGRQTARKSAPVDIGVDRLNSSRRKGIGARNEPKEDTQTPVAEGTTCETEKPSMSKLVPKSSEAVVTTGAKLHKPIEVEGGKSKEPSNDTDTAAKQKSFKRAPKIMPAETVAKAKEVKVHGKGKVADEGEGVTKAKGMARAQSVGGGERVERKRNDGTSESGKDKRVANGRTGGQGTSREVGEGRGSKVGEGIKDDRKAKSTGKELSRLDKNKDGSRSGSRVDIPITTGGEDLNPRKESDRSMARPKAKGTAVKREEAPSENEVSTFKGKGKSKEKAIVVEKRSLKEEENVKGGSSGVALSPKSQVGAREGRKESRRTSTPKAHVNRTTGSNREKVVTGSKKEANQRTNLGSPVTPRGRRVNTDVSKKTDVSPVARASIFGLEAGDKVPIEVEWPVEVQKSRKKTEEV